MKRLNANQRIGIAALLTALLLALVSGSARPAPIVSPLAVDRPTPTSEITLVPESYLSVIMHNYSPLPTPTVRPTP